MGTQSRRFLLSGSLAAFPPQEILQWLSHHTGEGTLSFEIGAHQPLPQGTVTIQYENGWLAAIKVVAETPPSRAANQLACPEPLGHHLGGLLVDKKLITPAELRYGLVHQEILLRKGRTHLLGDVLRRLELLDSETLSELLKELGIRALATLLGVRHGTFSVATSRLSMPYLTINERMDHLLLQAARLSDAPLER